MSLRQQLADALKSGKYKFGRSKLINEDGCNCVLGVACAISNLQTGICGPYDDIPCFYYRDKCFTHIPPEFIRDQLDSEGIDWAELIALNDRSENYDECIKYLETGVAPK